MENQEPVRQRFTIKRVPTPSPYVDRYLRVRYAKETIQSMIAEPIDQIIELELMFLDS